MDGDHPEVGVHVEAFCEVLEHAAGYRRLGSPTSARAHAPECPNRRPGARRARGMHRENEPEPTLAAPGPDGLPNLSVTVGSIAAAAELWPAARTVRGDAERAREFRLSKPGPYLIQIRRANGRHRVDRPGQPRRCHSTRLARSRRCSATDECICTPPIRTACRPGRHATARAYDTELCARLADSTGEPGEYGPAAIRPRAWSRGNGAADLVQTPLPWNGLNYAATRREVLI